MIAAVVEPTEFFIFWWETFHLRLFTAHSEAHEFPDVCIRVFTGRVQRTWEGGLGGRGWGSESKRECVLLPQISKESAEYMVEEYKRLRQRDSTGGLVAMATHCPM